MSGSTILGAQMATHQMQQEIEMLKNEPGYAEACSKIYPIIKKYRILADCFKNYAMWGGVVAGAIVGAAIGHSLEAYLPNITQNGQHHQLGEYPILCFAMIGSVIGETIGIFKYIDKYYELKRKAKKEIDDLGLEFTVDEGFL